MMQVFLLVLLTFGLASSQENVFEMGQNGYYCFRIPSLLYTLNGTLLAFAEGRKGSCNDHGWVDIVMKRSNDNGTTWSDLVVVQTASTPQLEVTIGNPCPLQDRDTGSIFLAFCRNNLEVFLLESVDDGASWSTARNITDVVGSHLWVATGPPGGVQLSTGRLLVPGDHGVKTSSDTVSFVMYSDDHGVTWQLGGQINPPTSGDYPNECQAVDLGNNHVLVNARNPSTYRFQALSTDGGQTFEPTTITTLREPVNGCEGSMIGFDGTLFFSNPASYTSSARANLTLHTSVNQGVSWQLHSIIQPSSAMYSSLAVVNGRVVVLYEYGTVPQALTYQVVWSPSK